MVEGIENCQNWKNQICGGCREPAAKEYPPLPPCNDLDEDVDDDDDDEYLGGDKDAVPLKQSDLDPVHNDHHLNKVFSFKFALMIMMKIMTRMTTTVMTITICHRYLHADSQ